MRQIRSLLSTAMRATADWSSFMRLLFVPLLLAELVLTALIILKIRFTHIDWRAYMEEVEGPLVHGVWDYAELRGETGPLVYPGGFVALYGALRLLAGGDGTGRAVDDRPPRVLAVERRCHPQSTVVLRHRELVQEVAGYVARTGIAGLDRVGDVEGVDRGTARSNARRLARTDGVDSVGGDE